MKSDRAERSRNGGVDPIPLPIDTGGLWLCGKHFVGPDPEAALARVGGSTIVCLNEAVEFADRYPEYRAWIDANQPDRAIWFPVPDLHAPDLEPMRTLLDLLRARLESGDVLLVHCGAGIGRAGTVAAALLITLGVPLDDAVATVAHHRPMAGPEAGVQRDLLEALSGSSDR